MVLELRSENIARKLAALVGIEDGRCPPAGDSLLHRIHAKLHVHGVRQPPSEHLAAVPIDHGAQVQPALVHAHVGDVHGPDLVGMGHRQIPAQVRVDLVLWVASAGARLTVQGTHTHALHQCAHTPAAYAVGRCSRLRSMRDPANGWVACKASMRCINCTCALDGGLRL